MGEEGPKSVVVYDNSDRNWLDNTADQLRQVGNFGNVASFIPNPYTRVGGGLLAAILDTGANVIDIGNGRVGVLGGLGRTAGDLGIDLLSILYPGAKTLKAMKAKPGLSTAYKVGTKGTKWINSGTRTERLGRIAGLTGAAIGTEYAFPGLNPNNNTSEFVNPVTGAYNEMHNDILNLNDPEAWGRAMKVASVPIILATRGKGLTKVSSKASKASKAAKTGSTASGSTATGGGTASGSGAATAAAAGTAAAGTAAAATGASSATGAAAGGAAGGAAAILLGMRPSKVSASTTRPTTRPTTSPTNWRYTGRPPQRQYNKWDYTSQQQEHRYIPLTEMVKRGMARLNTLSQLRNR